MRSLTLCLLSSLRRVSFLRHHAPRELALIPSSRLVRARPGKGTTFYSFLGIPATASVKEIAKAYKTLSVTMQSVQPPASSSPIVHLASPARDHALTP